MLPDGRVIFEGGEYIDGGKEVWSNLGAVYDPKVNAWTPVVPPAGWLNIGDAASVLLPSGVYMQANCCSHDYQTAFLDARTMTWTEGPNTLSTNNNEVGWTLLPNDTVLEVASEMICGTDKGSQIYQPSTNTWVCGPELPTNLYNGGKGDKELGSTVLTYNGEVLQVAGGTAMGTAILNLSTNTWSVGPTPPGNYNQDDAPSVVEPNGKVLLLMVDKLDGPATCQFFEFDPTTNVLSYAPNPPQCPNNNPGQARLLPLPTGQILFSIAYSHTLELYNPAGAATLAAAPSIAPPALSLYSGEANNMLVGSQLNGLSQAVFYGDDYQGATNYPLVQLIDAQGHVWYARNHDDSYSGIAPHKISYTKFDVPILATGGYTMRVVTNGIASNSVRVAVTQRQ